MAGLDWIVSMEEGRPRPSCVSPHQTGEAPVLHGQVKSE
jgi:hypothetical protein